MWLQVGFSDGFCGATPFAETVVTDMYRHTAGSPRTPNLNGTIPAAARTPAALSPGVWEPLVWYRHVYAAPDGHS